ncbi:MAG: PorP/SprF family type IX secretion system membrane protein [Bacteroidales bacterium]
MAKFDFKSNFGKSLTIIICLVFSHFSFVTAQDVEFSQFYANPLYLNPALAGTGECNRVILNYRNQWPSIEKGFVTYSASADFFVDALSGGLGIVAYSDDAAGLINTFRVSGIYSYHLKLSESARLNAGIEASYHRQQLKWNNLVFPDMIDFNTGAINPSNSSEPVVDNDLVNVADFSSGLVLGIKKTYYVGIAAHHLSQPKIAYYNNSENNRLFLKYTVHGGAYIKIKDSYFESGNGSMYISPNILYQRQLNAQQLNAGLSVNYYPLSAGVWYRHNFSNPDAIVFLLGIIQKRFKFGYSYDTSLSNLKGASGGAHEVSVGLLIMCSGKRKRPGAIKCPEF